MYSTASPTRLTSSRLALSRIASEELWERNEKRNPLEVRRSVLLSSSALRGSATAEQNTTPLKTQRSKGGPN